MSTRVCSRCRRPLPVPPSDGAAAAPCPFCAAADGAGRASEPAPARSTQPRSASSVPAPGMTQSAPQPVRRPPAAPPAVSPPAADPARRPDLEDPSPDKKRSQAFASALVETATRTTPVHSFAVPPEAIPVANQPRRRTPAPASAPAARSAGAVASAAPTAAAPSPRRATATLASLGPAVATVPVASPVRVVGGAAVAAPAAPMAMAPVYHGGGVASGAPAVAASAAAPARAHVPAPPAPALALVQTPPPGETTPPLRSAPTSSSARGPDAWNISSYLEAPAEAASALATERSLEPVPESQAAVDSVPVDIELRGTFATLLDRLPARRVGIALGCAAIVALLGVGGFKLLGRSRLAARDVPGTSVAPARARVTSAEPTAARAAASTAPAPAPPARVMPKLAADRPPSRSAAEAPPAPEPAPGAKSRAHAPREAAPVAHEEHRALPAPKVHARAEKARPAKPAAKAARKTASASKSPARPHRRVTARASTPEREDGDAFETDRMARARDTYRQGNERLFSGDAAGAITAYEEAIRLNPKDPAGYRGLGLANAQLGKRTEAVRHLRAYLKHAPNAEDRAIISSRISLLQTLP
ncbi:MAG TPA: tetratricopeptide repeat protein [Polyangia bacterium]|nr:tetratricopeptide repeat protein [Polyangia bacterium]